MKNEIDKRGNLEKSDHLPAGSLWRDLRFETGSGNGLEWLSLYEDDPLSIVPSSRLLYVKVVILSQAGRENAENGQSEILSKCNLRKFETATFCRALAIAMTEWDANHP